MEIKKKKKNFPHVRLKNPLLSSISGMQWTFTFCTAFMHLFSEILNHSAQVGFLLQISEELFSRLTSHTGSTFYGTELHEITSVNSKDD